MAYFGLAANGAVPVTQVAAASAECFRFKGFQWCKKERQYKNTCACSLWQWPCTGKVSACVSLLPITERWPRLRRSVWLTVPCAGYTLLNMLSSTLSSLLSLWLD